MNLRYHLQEVLRLSPAPSPWPRMFICAWATTIPLLIGVASNQLTLSIFGALVGFLLILNDHFGTLGHRLGIITLTFGVLMGGLTLGVFVHDHRSLFIPVLLILSYWMALLSGQGAELERALLFGIFQLLAGTYTPGLQAHLSAVYLYALLGYVNVVALLILLVILRRHTPNPFARFRASFKKSFTREKGRHLYAIVFCLTLLFSLIIVERLQMSHGYWAVGAVLVILRPDTKQSIYRGIQRFFGTLVGFLLAEAVIFSVHSITPAIIVIALVAFIAPWGLVRSYWLGSAVIALMLLVILDLPSLERGDFHTPLVRLQATGIGCLLSLIGVILMNPKLLWQEPPSAP